MDSGLRACAPIDAARIWLQFTELLQHDLAIAVLSRNDEPAAIGSGIGRARRAARGALATLATWRSTARAA